jgi:hypothetical protein
MWSSFKNSFDLTNELGPSLWSQLVRYTKTASTVSEKDLFTVPYAGAGNRYCLVTNVCPVHHGALTGNGERANEVHMHLS